MHSPRRFCPSPHTQHFVNTLETAKFPVLIVAFDSYDNRNVICFLGGFVALTSVDTTTATLILEGNVGTRREIKQDRAPGKLATGEGRETKQGGMDNKLSPENGANERVDTQPPRIISKVRTTEGQGIVAKSSSRPRDTLPPAPPSFAERSRWQVRYTIDLNSEFGKSHPIHELKNVETYSRWIVDLEVISPMPHFGFPSEASLQVSPLPQGMPERERFSLAQWGWYNCSARPRSSSKLVSAENHYRVGLLIKHLEKHSMFNERFTQHGIPLVRRHTAILFPNSRGMTCLIWCEMMTLDEYLERKRLKKCTVADDLPLRSSPRTEPGNAGDSGDERRR